MPTSPTFYYTDSDGDINENCRPLYFSLCFLHFITPHNCISQYPLVSNTLELQRPNTVVYLWNEDEQALSILVFMLPLIYQGITSRIILPKEYVWCKIAVHSGMPSRRFSLPVQLYHSFVLLSQIKSKVQALAYDISPAIMMSKNSSLCFNRPIEVILHPFLCATAMLNSILMLSTNNAHPWQ